MLRIALTVIQVLSAVLIMALVLLQKGKGPVAAAPAAPAAPAPAKAAK